MGETVQQGPASKPRRPHDFRKFDELMAGLQYWRDADHEDSIILCRSYVIEIIEGVKALQRPPEEENSE